MAMDVRAQACAYLRNGKVTIYVAMPPAGAHLADVISADVEGQSGTYAVRLNSTGWTCTCGHAEKCPHAAAVQLATGHPSLARKADKP